METIIGRFGGFADKVRCSTEWAIPLPSGVDLDWNAYLAALGPRGRLHSVAAVPTPLPIPAFTLLAGQKSVSGSPLGSPATTATMLEFCARHGIEAQTEHFPLSKVNEAFDHLKAGKARYRIVLDNDL